MTDRLAPATLDRLHASVVRPAYDRAALRPGIVHLGLGAFFRAHGMLYTEDALAQRCGEWGVIGASLRSPEQRDRLAPQAGLYTTFERSPDPAPPRLVGCLLDVLVAPENPEALLQRIAASHTRIVSLTVTEKGYCHAPATGRLDATHPDILADLACPHAPRSAPGFLLEALRRRRDAGLAPFTVVSCDNLPHNGALLAGIVRDLAALQDDGLAAWIEMEGAFPSTMVDRIVPAVAAEDRDAAERALGLHDAAPVLHEPFRQWVIEDRFIDDARPAWHEVGAQLVRDVAPFERMKLRLLNAAHSALAYLGLLAGHATIRDAVADPALRGFVIALWQDEAIPAVQAPPGCDLHAYVASLLQRFDNPSIGHRTSQIASDGSQKVPLRLLATICDRAAAGQPSPHLTLAVAAWLRCAAGWDDAGGPLLVADPLSPILRRLAAGEHPVAGMLGLASVFGDEPSERFAAALGDAWRSLATHGARGAALRLAADERSSR